jgi:hypothetical protein
VLAAAQFVLYDIIGTAGLANDGSVGVGGHLGVKR